MSTSAPARVSMSAFATLISRLVRVSSGSSPRAFRCCATFTSRRYRAEEDAGGEDAKPQEASDQKSGSEKATPSIAAEVATPQQAVAMEQVAAEQPLTETASPPVAPEVFPAATPVA